MHVKLLIKLQDAKSACTYGYVLYKLRRMFVNGGGVKFVSAGCRSAAVTYAEEFVFMRAGAWK